MNRKILVLLLALFPSVSPAAVSSVALEPFSANLSDKASLQRGARMFSNYCLSCHSAQYMRYNRIARDLGISEDMVAENLMFASDKVVDQLTVAMRVEDGENWFGRSPPDLSVVARSRGPEWISAYLLGFYQDEDPARLFGVNNLVFPAAAMPNVLWALQGIRKPLYEDVADHDGRVSSQIMDFEMVRAGSMSDGEFKRAVYDLVNFMVYVGEPAKLDRYRVGMWVLLFIAFFFMLARALYKEYWRDVH